MPAVLLALLVPTGSSLLPTSGAATAAAVNSRVGLYASSAADFAVATRAPGR